MPTVVNPEVPETGFFVIVKWESAYGSDTEYRWSGAYTTRAAASAAGKCIWNRGPKRFIDWMTSARPCSVYQGVEAFQKAAAKVGLNPRVDEVEFHD